MLVHILQQKNPQKTKRASSLISNLSLISRKRFSLLYEGQYSLHHCCNTVSHGLNVSPVSSRRGFSSGFKHTERFWL